MDLLFKNATIVTLDDACPLINCGFLGVQYGKIVYLGTKEPKIRAKRNIDCKGNILMPGLINTHTHIPMSLMRGFADDYNLQDWLNNHVFPTEAKLDARCVKVGAQLGMMECVRFGTTSISDMYYFIPAIAKAALDGGIKANISNSALCFDRENYDFETQRSTMEMREMLVTYHNADKGRIRLDAAIHGEYTSFDTVWRKSAEFAKEHGLNMQVHLSETKAEHEECIVRYGKTPAEILSENGVFDTRATAAHCTFITPGDMDILAEKHVTAAHNPVSNLKLGSGVAPVSEMIKHGMNVAVATDGVCSNNSHDMFEEIKTAAILQKGITGNPQIIPALEALKMAAVNGAFAQGREQECGVLKEKFDADIIMIDVDKPSLTPMHNPISTLCYSAKGSDVVLNMVRGNILYENGEYKTLDFEQIKYELNNYVMPRVFGK